MVWLSSREDQKCPSVSQRQGMNGSSLEERGGGTAGKGGMDGVIWHEEGQFPVMLDGTG